MINRPLIKNSLLSINFFILNSQIYLLSPHSWIPKIPHKNQYIILDMNRVIESTKTKNQYLLLQKIGEGAYADVYKGENVATKEIVAIKKMKSMKKSDKQMAEKQVELMKCLKHKNIVRWIDDFRSNGIWFIVLEYCGKGDLQKYKETVGKLPENHCKALVHGILEALIQLHSEKKIIVQRDGIKQEIKKPKIAHRDLKLANILINDQHQLKLADFGFSKDFEDGWLKSFCGTPLTMAPEVLRREKYNEKCDVWSLGVIAYYLLYNKFPFLPSKAEGAGIPGLTKAVSSRMHVFDSNVMVSDNGKDFINRCLQKSIENRPFSHELLKHPWWDSVVRWTAITKQVFENGVKKRPEDEAQIKLKTMFFGAIVDHIKKIYQGLLITEKIIKKISNLLKNYYSDRPIILSNYLKIINQKMAALRNRDVLFTFEQETSDKIKKHQINFNLSAIKCQKEFEKDINKIVAPLQESSQSDSKPIQEIVLFLIEETDKLMDSFNQTEVDEKLELFRLLAKFITIDFDQTFITVRWGQREDLSQFGIYVQQAIFGLNSAQVIAIINEQIVDQEDLESIWAMEHHIVASPYKNSTQNELGQLVLSILNISSNFNIDRTMHTETLHFQKFESDD